MHRPTAQHARPKQISAAAQALGSVTEALSCSNHATLSLDPVAKPSTPTCAALGLGTVGRQRALDRQDCIHRQLGEKVRVCADDLAGHGGTSGVQQRVAPELVCAQGQRLLYVLARLQMCTQGMPVTWGRLHQGVGIWAVHSLGVHRFISSLSLGDTHAVHDEHKM